MQLYTHTHPRALDGKSEQGRYDRLLLPISGQVGPGIRPRYCAWQVPCLLRGATVYNSNLLRADSPPSDTQCQTCAWRNAGNGEAGRWTTTTYWCDDHSVRLDFYGTHPSPSQCQCGVTTCATPERFSSVDIFFRRHASKSVSSGTVKLDSGHMLNTLSVVPIMKAGVFFISTGCDTAIKLRRNGWNHRSYWLVSLLFLATRWWISTGQKKDDECLFQYCNGSKIANYYFEQCFVMTNVA